MGYSLAVYAIDLDQLRSRIAAGDRTLLESLSRKHAESIRDYDDEIDEYWDEEEESESGGLMGSIKGLFARKAPEPPAKEPAPESPPTGQACLEAMLTGGTTYESISHVYGYMFEWVCQELGERQATPFESMRSGSGWLEGLDQALDKCGIDLGVFSLAGNLTARGAPIGIPMPHDFPGIGYIESAEIAQALPRLKNLDRAVFAEATPYPEEGGEALDGMIRMAEAAHNSGRGLVGFYY